MNRSKPTPQDENPEAGASVTPKILVVGGANLDITGSCFNRLIPGDSNPGIIKNSPGGVGRNIAENLQRLGIQTSLLSIIGRDFGGSLILRYCNEAGIDTSAFFEHETLSTGTYMAINNQIGSLLAAISDMAVIDTLSPCLLEKRLSYFAAADEIILEANLSKEAIEWICQTNPRKRIHADAVSATKAVKLKPVLKHLDTLKVNREEAAAIIGSHGDDEFLAKSLFDQGVNRVLLSKGPQGCSLYSKEAIEDTAAIKGENISDTGAGDALLAGFIAAQYLLKSQKDRLQFASACATFALGSEESVNPLLSTEQIRSQFLSHLDKEAWL
ncbi:carbohydrate kinase family protein [Reinekea marinisedimentorum]|uniref:Pseudouridine kinase n=1 Tax=Reinekea marinisedimentorum TaxID=230495 RepID=A0A4R3ICC3_9GAMM|nr:carbohydrate kinase family protein [Reinekea marinisedimentorum]TCS43037.1 pseudouridine kinase [Reinekea marinisedimentorum]